MKIALFYIKEKIASTVYDHLEAFQKYSVHEVYYLNALDQSLTLELLNQFDIIVIHYTVSIFYDDRCPFWLRLMLRQAKAKKVVFIQDEYRFINDVIDNLNYLKIDLLFTCIPQNEIEKVYPTSKLPNLKKVNTLTGFVPQNLLTYRRVSYSERLIDVGYRARKLSAWYGKLGQEKWSIAEKFSHDALKYCLKADISYHEEDRIYGMDWIRFLQNSKAALGCESGASVFDFTGDIQGSVEAYEKNNPKASFEEIEEKFFPGIDGKIKLNQISPRCFECAALGTLMILYEGDYSGILKPWEHYVPLKKDHSNMASVVEVLRDQQRWEEITEKTYLEIAMNPRYSYKFFVESFDENLKIFFNEPSVKLEEKNQFLLSFKLEDFNRVTKESISLKSCLKKIILKFLHVLPNIFSTPLEIKLHKIKRRLMLSVNTLEILLKSFNFYYILLFLNKSFCEELERIFLIREYIFFLRKKLSVSPIAIDFLDKNSIKISVTPDVPTNVVNNWECIANAHSIQLVCADSWGVPKNMRGIQQFLKYKKLVKYIVDL